MNDIEKLIKQMHNKEKVDTLINRLDPTKTFCWSLGSYMDIYQCKHFASSKISTCEHCEGWKQVN